MLMTILIIFGILSLLASTLLVTVLVVSARAGRAEEGYEEPIPVEIPSYAVDTTPIAHRFEDTQPV